MSDEPRTDLEPRALPGWAWGLALICHPPGLFIALAAARAIRWSTALILAVASWLISVAFVYGMTVMESEGGENPVLLGMGAYLLAVGYVQYRLGLRVNLWTDRAIRLWYKLGCVAILCAVVAVLVLIGIGVRALGKGSTGRYTDPDGRFSIDVPAGWKMEHAEGGITIAARGSDEDPAVLDVAVAPHKSPDDTLEDTADKVLSGLKKDAAIRIVDSGQAEIGGRQAARISFAKRAPPVGELQITIYIVLWEGNAIIVSLGAKPASSRWSTLEEMLNSFTLGH